MHPPIFRDTDALTALMNAARHIMGRKLDEAREGKLPRMQVFMAAMAIEAGYAWLRLCGPAPENREHRHVVCKPCKQAAPVVATPQPKAGDFGPN